jgi:hypothetical protein
MCCIMVQGLPAPHQTHSSVLAAACLHVGTPEDSFTVKVDRLGRQWGWFAGKSCKFSSGKGALRVTWAAAVPCPMNSTATAAFTADKHGRQVESELSELSESQALTLE